MKQINYDKLDDIYLIQIENNQWLHVKSFTKIPYKGAHLIDFYTEENKLIKLGEITNYYTYQDMHINKK